MKRYFMEGGPLFMGLLTFIFLIILVLVVYNLVIILKKEGMDKDVLKNRLSYIKSVGLFALVFGILGQLLGLYQMFDAIQRIGDTSPVILAGGLKVSMLSALYGVLIYLLSWLFWFGLDAFSSRGAK